MSLKNMFQMNQVLMLLELTKTKFKKHMDDMVDVGCLMLATMTPELQKQHEDMVAYEMIQNLKEIYEGQARQESGSSYHQDDGLYPNVGKLGFPLNDELAIDVIMQSLSDSFNQFVLNFNMNEIYKTLPQLLGMLRTTESNMKKSGSKSILMVRVAKGKGKKVVKSKGIGKTKPKGKNALKTKGGISKEGKCFHCDKPGHWKRNCPVYLEVVKKAKVIGVSYFGKMTKAPFSGKGERASDLLGLIHSDACGPMNTQARGGFQYFITFTDDFSRYGYIYLMRHKSEALEKFKEFKNEVQNQHGKSIKALRSDRGEEYLSQDFDELLKECGIVSQLTPPGMPQWNGVSKRRNRTLLDMVRSMMSHTDLPTSFWGHALETTAFTLNCVASKSVQKTPHEMWTGKRPNMSFMKVIEPEVEQTSQVVEENPTDLETQPLRRSTRERHEPERYGFLVTTHGDVILVDQDETKTYQEAVSSPDSEKWLEAMRSEMDSMSENQVWTLVEPPEGIKPIG
ncbi:hypothetical protein V6N13_098424 [Hibiscus sabdariffa]